MRGKPHFVVPFMLYNGVNPSFRSFLYLLEHNNMWNINKYKMKINGYEQINSGKVRKNAHKIIREFTRNYPQSKV